MRVNPGGMLHRQQNPEQDHQTLRVWHRPRWCTERSSDHQILAMTKFDETE
jgi:hypothetical protein